MKQILFLQSRAPVALPCYPPLFHNVGALPSFLTGARAIEGGCVCVCVCVFHFNNQRATGALQGGARVLRTLTRTHALMLPKSRSRSRSVGKSAAAGALLLVTKVHNVAHRRKHTAQRWPRRLAATPRRSAGVLPQKARKTVGSAVVVPEAALTFACSCKPRCCCIALCTTRAATAALPPRQRAANPALKTPHSALC